MTDPDGGPARSRRAPATAVSTLGAAVALVAALLVPSLLARPAAARPVAAVARPRAAFPPQRPTKVLVLGDSVMAGAATRYGPDLPGRDVTVDAVVNRTTGQGADVVARRGADWDVVVILLGHNDGGTAGVYQPAAIRLLDQLDTVPRVVWLTLHEVRPAYAGVNQFLRAQAAHRPNLRIADWNAVASANPGAIAHDGLHLNGAGAGLMAGFVAQQVVQAEQDHAAAIRAFDVARVQAAAHAFAVARFEAAAARRAAPTTTTTRPATTTTEPPGVSLIPSETVDRPAGATTTGHPTTTRPKACTPADPACTVVQAPPAPGSRTGPLALVVAGGLLVLVGLGSLGRLAIRRRRHAGDAPDDAPVPPPGDEAG